MKSQFNDLCERVYKNFKSLCEVRYIDTRSTKFGGNVYKNNPYDIYKQDAIKNDDKIRVFHGCSLETAVDWAINGTSGRERHPRTYSYESGMNPLGIFVTVDFETAKKFGDGHECLCIVEFTASANDLESPIWNGSNSYFGQGSNPQPFRNKEERDLQKQRYNNDAMNIKDDTYWNYKKNRLETTSFDYIRKSDKPALAMSIFDNPERQALFMGNLAPNQIKRIWINQKDEETGYISQNKSYKPLTVKQFLKKFRNYEFDVSGSYGQKKQKITRNKYYYPNEDFKGFDDFFDRMEKEDGWKISDEQRKENIEYIKQYDHYKETVCRHMFPRQIAQAFGEKFFNDNFNYFGQ